MIIITVKFSRVANQGGWLCVCKCKINKFSKFVANTDIGLYNCMFTQIIYVTGIRYGVGIRNGMVYMFRLFSSCFILRRTV